MNDTLLAAFKRIMSISDLQTSLVQFAFYGSYFCFALPAALFIRKYSYKCGILIGIALYALGTMLFTPAGSAASYPFYLLAIYVMAGGCAILETAANPFILSLGPAESATRRLNIAQMFNPLGAIIGIFLSRFFILEELYEADAAERSMMTTAELSQIQAQEFSAISGTYLIIGVVLLVLFLSIFWVKMPVAKDETELGISAGQLIRKLWHTPKYRNGVIAQFFYVGAQTCVWSFTIRLVMSEIGVRESAASNYFLCAILGFTAFRFIFTGLMKYIKPAKLMIFASTGAILCTAIVIITDGITAVVSLVCISAFMSLMFPTIYGIALEGMQGAEAKLASSGLIMAIVGGALITPLQGFISDVSCNISLSFTVPLICFIVIFVYSIYATKQA
ncbi:MAG: L-fucose:H+ symporter permease [Bacteroides sp.]|nr:L-fucose:H+ symporter permease [Bacteroides sp.]MCM1379962.1 L-fucose:H+ symporter permease [Bacteroides sp.]MCM1446283.1 L-fucose:H+ symporter permease [Prevotella sp.]